MKNFKKFIFLFICLFFIFTSKTNALTIDNYKIYSMNNIKLLEDPKPSEPRLDYDSLCSSKTDANKGIRSAAKIVGYVIAIGKWVVPLLIIAFGMIDFVKAVVSSDDKALNKATSSFILRIVAGIMVFVVPIAAKAILHIAIDTKGIDSTSDGESSYAACTRCILDPFNDCK